jgi:putrescine transport system ATP-binding protein
MGTHGVTGRPPLVSIEHVSQSFGAVRAVDDVSFTIQEGEFFALLGPSGCGKTSLMRMIAGFGEPDRGRIILAGQDVTHVPPHKRPVNMMFQNYALFPHLNVFDNVAFGLREDGVAKNEISARVADALRLVQMQPYAERKPQALSGGQKQRVALARAIVKRPKLVLLDEPLAALDRRLREETQEELKHLQKSLGIAFLVVTHDQDEAMMMADRIAVMSAGRVLQIGTPADLYERPASQAVARFIGDANVIEPEIRARLDGRALIAVDSVPFEILTGPVRDFAIGVRPEKIRMLDPHMTVPGSVTIEATVEQRLYRGDVTELRVRTARHVWRVAMLNASRRTGFMPEPGERVRIAFAPEDAMVLPE